MNGEAVFRDPEIAIALGEWRGYLDPCIEQHSNAIGVAGAGELREQTAPQRQQLFGSRATMAWASAELALAQAAMRASTP